MLLKRKHPQRQQFALMLRGTRNEDLPQAPYKIVCHFGTLDPFPAVPWIRYNAGLVSGQVLTSKAWTKQIDRRR